MDDWPWSELEIAATAEESAIRRAYASRLKKIDADTDPGTFIRLRQAYEDALDEAEAEDASPTEYDDAALAEEIGSCVTERPPQRPIPVDHGAATPEESLWDHRALPAFCENFAQNLTDGDAGAAYAAFRTAYAQGVIPLGEQKAFLDRLVDSALADQALTHERLAEIEQFAEAQDAVAFRDDPTERLRFLRRRAELGDPQAQNALAEILAGGERGAARDYTEAAAWFRKAALQGHAAAQYNLGCLYEHGLGVQASDAEAIDWFRKAAEQGFAAAQNNLSRFYAAGRGTTRDDAEAVAWCRKSAENGNATAQYRLASMYWQGRGVARDYAETAAWLRKAAEQGCAEAQFDLGYLYAHGLGVLQSDAESTVWYRKAAEQGNASAQCNLGLAYEYGQGVPLDYDEARAWYRRAADQGDWQAQCNLGAMYGSGRGAARDYTEAAAWFRKAALQGHAAAQYNLAFLYHHGLGVPQSDDEAEDWYRKAAEQGHAGAQCSLGFFYEYGRGAPLDYDEAVAWYRRAADQGDSQAQSNLGEMYQYGRSVQRDDAEAARWYLKAAEQGLAYAQRELGLIYLYGEGVERDLFAALQWLSRAQASGAEVWDDLARAERLLADEPQVATGGAEAESVGREYAAFKESFSASLAAKDALAAKAALMKSLANGLIPVGMELDFLKDFFTCALADSGLSPDDLDKSARIAGSLPALGDATLAHLLVDLRSRANALRWLAEVEAEARPRNGWRRWLPPSSTNRVARILLGGRLPRLSGRDMATLRKRIAEGRPYALWFDGRIGFDEVEARLKRFEMREYWRWGSLVLFLLIGMPSINQALAHSALDKDMADLTLFTIFGLSLAIIGPGFFRTIGVIFLAFVASIVALVYFAT